MTGPGTAPSTRPSRAATGVISPHRTGDKDLLGGPEFCGRHVPHFSWNASFTAEFQDHRSRDALRTGPRGRGHNPAFPHCEQMGGTRLGQHARGVEQHSIINTGSVRLEFRKDARELVAAVDVLIEHVGEGPPLPGRDQPDPVLVVEDRRLVLGEDEERAARLVDPRIEAACVFKPPRDGQPHVHPVMHLIGRERKGQFRHERCLGRNTRVCQHCRTLVEPSEMGPEPEDAAIVESQPLPDGVAVLNA